MPWIMLLQAVMQKKQQEAAEQKARQQAIADSHARQAGRYGFPGDGYEADKFNKQFTDAAEQQKQQWVASMLGAVTGGMGKGPGMYGQGGKLNDGTGGSYNWFAENDDTPDYATQKRLGWVR